MISQTLTSEYMSHDLYQVRDKSSAAQFITALFFIISGFIIAASSFAVTDYGIMFRLFMMTMGSVIAVYGLVLCFKGSDENVVYPIQDSVEEHHLYFDKAQKKTLMSIINVDGIPDCIKPTSSYSGIVRLDIYLSEDCKFATLQLMQYKSGFFCPLTNIHYYSDGDAKRISDLLELYNKD